MPSTARHRRHARPSAHGRGETLASRHRGTVTGVGHAGSNRGHSGCERRVLGTGDGPRHIEARLRSQVHPFWFGELGRLICPKSARVIILPRKLVLGTGLEPARLAAKASKTFVSAIPPPERGGRGPQLADFGDGQASGEYASLAPPPLRAAMHAWSKNSCTRGCALTIWSAPLPFTATSSDCRRRGRDTRFAVGQFNERVNAWSFHRSPSCASEIVHPASRISVYPWRIFVSIVGRSLICGQASTAAAETDPGGRVL